MFTFIFAFIVSLLVLVSPFLAVALIVILVKRNANKKSALEVELEKMNARFDSLKPRFKLNLDGTLERI